MTRWRRLLCWFGAHRADKTDRTRKPWPIADYDDVAVAVVYGVHYDECACGAQRYTPGYMVPEHATRWRWFNLRRIPPSLPAPKAPKTGAYR